ncbi:MAG: hypothetical protein ACREEW_17625 [Caulobacteraceae bacterium]
MKPRRDGGLSPASAGAMLAAVVVAGVVLSMVFAVGGRRHPLQTQAPNLALTHGSASAG